MADTTIERKTVNAVVNALSYYLDPNGAALGKKSNVLNQYRSVSYNFTLAALKKSQLNDPASFNPNNPDFVIVSTKGKRIGSGGGMSTNTDPLNTAQPARTVNANSSDSNTNNANATNQVSSTDPSATQKLNQQQANNFAADYIGQFNQESPGRFDMFIDDVDILSTFSFNEGTATTLPTEMNFQVIEPYSMNGFMEALQAAAIGAGYTDYASCSFVMIIDFTGYPAQFDIPMPMPIPGASRTFIITIAGVDAEINEKGTVYKIKAVLSSGLLFGERIGTLKRKISAKGNTVKDLLDDLTTGINNENIATARSKGVTDSFIDQYEILFPKYDNNDRIIPGEVNDIGKSGYGIESGSQNLSKMQDIDSTKASYLGKSTNTNSRPETKSTAAVPLATYSAQFDSGLPIQSAIAAAIRDSDYVKNIIKAFMEKDGGAKNKVDPNQMVDYFIIIPKVRDQEGPINPTTNRPYKVYSYIVKQYKMLYNMAVPGQSRQRIDDKKLQQLTLRNYNYMYTGLNTDVLDFKINFNTLFYETLPKALGNPPERVVTSSDKAKPGNSNIVKEKTLVPMVANQNSNFTAPRADSADMNSQNPGGMPNAGPGGLEYYNQMVKAMHSTIVTSNAGLVTGELSILGDPYYITSGASGNNASSGGKQGGYAGNQEAAVSAGQVLVSVNFNNPIDINRSTGLMKFQQKVMPFSGVFQVNTVRHKFKNGLFTQDLQIIRVPGQPQNSSQIPDELNNQFTSESNKTDKLSTDTAPVDNQNRTTQGGKVELANNSINLDEQGFITASTPTPGGLGGSSNPVFGAQNSAGRSLSATYGIIPNGVNQLASGIRASTQGLYDIQNAVLGPAASINAAARIFGSASPISQSAINNVANVATRIDGALSQSLTNPLLNLSSRLTSPINNIEANVSNAVFGLAGSINRAFGINASGITGLTGALSSRLLASLTGASIPQNVNLSVASNQGLLLDKLPTLDNIPATVSRSVQFNGGFIGGNPVSPSASNAQLNNPLATQNYRLTGYDSTVQTDKLGSSIAMFNQTTNQQSSNEGLKLSINNSLGNNSSGLNSTVNYQFGSISGRDTTSPLVTALNNSNNTA